MANNKPEQKNDEEARDLTAERDERVKPVVRDILRVLNEYSDELQFGSAGITEDEMHKYYAEFVKDKIEPILLAHPELEVQDITYIFSLLKQITGFVNGKVDQGVQKYYDTATAHLYGRDHVDQIKLNDVISILKDKYEDFRKQQEGENVDNSQVDKNKKKE